MLTVSTGVCGTPSLGANPRVGFIMMKMETNFYKVLERKKYEVNYLRKIVSSPMHIEQSSSSVNDSKVSEFFYSISWGNYQTIRYTVQYVLRNTRHSDYFEEWSLITSPVEKKCSECNQYLRDEKRETFNNFKELLAKIKILKKNGV